MSLPIGIYQYGGFLYSLNDPDSIVLFNAKIRELKHLTGLIHLILC